jgi:ADP-ribosylglycohydrolase
MEQTNTQLLNTLFQNHSIDANLPSKLLQESKPDNIDIPFSKIEGMLLGVAIGDSLGQSTESLTPSQRQKNYGLVEEYLPNKWANYRKVGIPSDDTQLAFDTLAVILDNGYLNMDELAKVFASHKIFGIGTTMKDFLRNYKNHGKPWYESGTKSAGNGALMRISPVLIPYINTKTDLQLLWDDTILDTMMTHNDALAIGSSLAFVDLLKNFLSDGFPNKPESVLDRFCNILSEVIGSRKYPTRESLSGRLWNSLRYGDDASRFIKHTVNKALSNDISTEILGNEIGSGAYLLETVPMSLFVILRYGCDPQEAILQAVNYTKDNDTVGSIVGTAMGSLYGKGAFRESWLSGLLGRIRERDDGTVFRMIEETRYFYERR